MRRERTRPGRTRIPAAAGARVAAARGGAAGSSWDKVGRVALVLVLFAILASYVSPALNFFDSWRDSKRRARGADRASIREREAPASGSRPSAGRDAAEREARKHGMVRAGRGART